MPTSAAAHSVALTKSAGSRVTLADQNAMWARRRAVSAPVPVAGSSTAAPAVSAPPGSSARLTAAGAAADGAPECGATTWASTARVAATARTPSGRMRT